MLNENGQNGRNTSPSPVQIKVSVSSGNLSCFG